MNPTRLADMEQRHRDELRREALRELDRLEEACVNAYEVLASVGLSPKQVFLVGDLLMAEDTVEQIAGTADLIRAALSDPDGRVDL